MISAIIDHLDISEIESGYVEGGTSSCNPRMIFNVIVYAYLNNVYSRRQMEKLLVENIAYLWLSVMQTPDFRTINIFRSKRLEEKFDGLRGRGKPCVSVNPETDSGRSAKTLFKFTLAANVPQNAYIDTSLPRWSKRLRDYAPNV